MGVIDGLEYLHSKDVVHGDVRGVRIINFLSLLTLTIRMFQSNVLISNDGIPLIADFGLTFVIDHTEFTTSKIAGPARWTAPEILNPPNDEMEPPYSKQSDVFAFSMTAIEVSLRCSLIGLLNIS